MREVKLREVHVWHACPSGLVKDPEKGLCDEACYLRSIMLGAGRRSRLEWGEGGGTVRKMRVRIKGEGELELGLH